MKITLREILAFLTLYGLGQKLLRRKIKPISVLSYNIKSVIYGSLAAKLARVSYCYALITGLGFAFTGKPKAKRALAQKAARTLYRMALKRTDCVFFQNPDDQLLFTTLNILPQGACFEIVNGSGVDLTYFEVTPIPVRPVVFLLIARLLGDKGVREYVSAAAEVKKRYPETIFRIVGYLDENPDCISVDEVTEWGSEGVIQYLGILEDVRPAISDSSVYVLPSYREGMPRTVLEAMSMGRPIITTNAPGCRETVVEGVNGFLVPVKAVAELAAAMEKFVLEPQLINLMGARSRKFAEEKFDVNKVNAKMLAGMGVIRK